jgi:EAL domain-containing protein (putative c-di-GMP-specific phosphodiesterase class I)
VNGNRLLIIDDDPEIADIFAQVGEAAGFSVRAASTATDFRRQLQDWLPTIVLVDLRMPGTDGIELLRLCARERPPAKFIIASGLDQRVVEAAARLARSFGLDVIGAMVKPVRIAELTALLLAHRAAQPATMAELDAAITAEEIVGYWQPKLSVATREVIGAEVLARWRHPVHGMLFPDHFIPLAEGSELIQRLTWCVVERSLEQHAEWAAAGFALPFAVNLSARCLTDLDLPDRLVEMCDRHGVSPERMTLEITESAAMRNQIEGADILTRLRIKGIHLSIDDFGTGYSSLAQLQRLPFSELKIDKSFVMPMMQSRDCSVIVKTVIGMAHNLGLRAVAEGVENEECLALLADWQCDEMQGYLFSRALAPEDVPAFMKSQGATE